MSGSEWLTSPRSLRLFSWASITMLICVFYLLSLLALSGTKILTQLEASAVFRAFSGLVGVVSAPAGIYLFIGMFWYWAALDTSARSHKILWLVSFLFVGFITLPLYELVVYRRQAMQLLEVAHHR